MSEHITIAEISPRIQFAGDGMQTDFIFPFPIFKDEDLEIYVDDSLQLSGFSVVGAGNSAGGAVTFDMAPLAGELVTLRRRLAVKRTSDFQEGGEFRAKVINDELDYQTACLQELSDALGRSLRLKPTDVSSSVELPEVDERAGKILGFDESGNPSAFSVNDFEGPQGPQGLPGDMSGANNLSELTDKPAALATLGGLAINGNGANLSGIEDWQAIKTENYTAADRQAVFTDTSGGVFTVTLPETPSLGARVTVHDSAGAWAANNLTVDGNGTNINGAASFTCDVADRSAKFVFNGTEWRLVNNG